MVKFPRTIIYFIGLFPYNQLGENLFFVAGGVVFLQCEIGCFCNQFYQIKQAVIINCINVKETYLLTALFDLKLRFISNIIIAPDELLHVL